MPKTDKTELITNGIYQISRNPAFLGFDLLYLRSGQKKLEQLAR